MSEERPSMAKLIFIALLIATTAMSVSIAARVKKNRTEVEEPVRTTPVRNQTYAIA